MYYSFGTGKVNALGGFTGASVDETPASWTLEFDAAGAPVGDYAATLTFSTRDQQGLSGATDLADVVYELTAAVATGADAPEQVAVYAGFERVAPNPFRASAVLEYGLTAPGPVRLEIFDVTGRELRRLVDAQREAGEAYIASQRHEGWETLPTDYSDGGFTGANTDRPGLQKLLRDIGYGRIDCVIVYKVDRLSRSLLDFARMMETFEKHQVSFVSVTQHFNTATPMGRLILNILLSFQNSLK